MTMRRFSSYGPVDKDVHFYAPREELISRAYTQLVGENLLKGGHYFTVWASRQCGKTWIMQQVLFRLQQEGKFTVLKINLEDFKDKTSAQEILRSLAGKIGVGIEKSFTDIDNQEKFMEIFEKEYLDKPLILILDEFDALLEEGINVVVSAFRNIYNSRLDEIGKTSGQKSYLLHGAALIGVRSVLGIENQKGSPFNVQRSLHVPHLTFEEVRGMFQWYEKESGQHVYPEVVERLYYETNGQPGLTSWFGELLTEGCEFYSNDKTKPITMNEFRKVFAAAAYVLPNNNIMNLISKAREEDNKTLLLKMFQTDDKLKFRFDNKTMNALYMNGLVVPESEDGETFYLKFACPFVQQRLFNYFSDEYFNDMGRLIDPFTDLDDIITPTDLDILQLLKLYQLYLDKNKSWLFKNVPRRSDQRIMEAVFHFNFYSYFHEFLRGKNVNVIPEFPTGNGKIDILLHYGNNRYGIELKSFRDKPAHKIAQEKAAHYGKQLGLTEIYLVSFIETIDEETRGIFEKPFTEPVTGVTVKPFFIQTGLV